MNIRQKLFRAAIVVVTLVCVSFGFLAAKTNAQQNGALPTSGFSATQSSGTQSPPGQSSAAQSPAGLFSEAVNQYRFSRLASTNSRKNKVAELVKVLKSSEASESDRSAAKGQLTDVLATQFDEDLKARETRIAQLEEQLKSLREQILKRRDAKSRLIDLRIQLLLNEADGLGFPKAWNQTSGRFPQWQSPGLDSIFTAPAAPVPPVPALSPTATIDGNR
ncbi:MAG: hypothetical protein AAFX06_02450 [Planctomycetota bacterium]